MTHNKYLKMIRPGDIIIIVLLLAASFIPYVVFARQQAAQSQPGSGRTLTAYVTHNGKRVYQIQLTGHHGTSRYHYQAGNEYNDIVTTGDQIQIIDANCPDQVCVKKGRISKPGQTIVCLPHKLLVEIKSSTGDSGGGMVTE
ncbi:MULTISPECIES: NusG domain II-containing protein [unclassified Lacticaseibacillus]|uniref:NusG domain II-containing protein n=1 Tax=unclassified Lacticaseibacillus TaxID=2759744 RepID=UPI001944C91A|nr:MULTISPECIES: NusG domain II-containing protein [unclassified Lacticaseibacillus]